MDSAAADSPRIGAYWLARRLGAGGQGTVYEAYDQRGVRVAVKLLNSPDSPKVRERFAREAMAATRVASFCTARVLDADLSGRVPYIVSEYVQGPSLRQAVQQGRRFSGGDLHRLATAIATALTAVHEAGVIHRDLKPGNVLLAPDGPRVIDFGIARTAEMSLSSTGQIAGTPTYMAPEVLSGRRADASADVFAWGGIVLFAATGEDPFRADNLAAVLHRVLSADPDLSILPSALRRLVATALAKDPGQRPPARDLLLALVREQDPGAVGLLDAGSSQARGLRMSSRADPALGALAEDAYRLLSSAEQDLVPGLFLRLVTVGEDKVATPRAVPVAELLRDRPGEERAALEHILDAFSGLVSRQDGHARLTHAALLRAWPRLRGWVDADREGLVILAELAVAAGHWAANGKKGADLLRGSRLEPIRRWAATGRQYLTLTGLERAFLDASAKATIRSARQRRLAVISLVILLVAALTGAGAAVYAAGNANTQRRIAEIGRNEALSRQLAAQSTGIADADPLLAQVLATASWHFAPTPEARHSLLNVYARPARQTFPDDTGAVIALAYSPDARTLATGDTEGAVRLWDPATRRQIGPPLTGHRDNVEALAFSPDGKSLASAGDDGTVRVWDMATHRQIGRPLPGHRATAAFSPDGRFLATASGKTARLRDAKTHAPTGAPLVGHLDSVTHVAFSPDGETLATTSEDRTIRLWNVATHRQIGHPLSGHTDSVNLAIFSPDGKTLASASENDATIRIWDVTTRRQNGNPLISLAFPAYLAFSPDGGTLATGHHIGQYGDGVRLWDVRTRKQLGPPFPTSGLSLYALAYSPDGRSLATVDDRVRLWDLTVHRQIGRPFTDPLSTKAAFGPDGTTLITVGDKVRRWDVATRRQIGRPINHGVSATSALSPDGATMAITRAGDTTAQLWDLTTGKRRGPPYPHPKAVGRMIFSLDGKVLLIMGTDGAPAQAWEVATHRRIGRSLSVNADAAALSPDGKTLVTGHDDGTAHVWDLHTGRQVGRPFIGHLNTLIDVTFSPDATTLATASWDHTVRLWDVATHRQIGQPFTGHADAPVVVFSPDGKRLATADTAGIVRLWDAATHRQIGLPLIGHIDEVTRMAFSPDGTALATTGNPVDGTFRLWNVAPPADPYRSVCAIAERSLTHKEWEQYLPGVPYQEICR